MGGRIKSERAIKRLGGERREKRLGIVVEQRLYGRERLLDSSFDTEFTLMDDADEEPVGQRYPPTDCELPQRIHTTHTSNKTKALTESYATNLVGLASVIVSYRHHP